MTVRGGEGVGRTPSLRGGGTALGDPMQRPFGFAATAVAAALTLALAGTATADVRVAVSPEILAVAPGATLTLELLVPVPGSAFNGYDAIIDYDPAILTFLPTVPPSLQEGAAMTGTCGNTFHIFSAAGDSLSISDVLMCPDTSLVGPAQLYRLNFRAASTPGVTTVRLRSVQFYNAGYYVNPAVPSNATIYVGGSLDAGPPARTTGTRLAVRSNPGRGEQWLDVSSPLAGDQRLVVYDAAGRAVRHLEAGTRAAGTHTVRWDGRDDAGRGVPAGIYLVHVSAAGGSARASLVRLR